MTQILAICPREHWCSIKDLCLVILTVHYNAPVLRARVSFSVTAVVR